MTHPLDGARLKIVRAQEHLDSLKFEIGKYLDSQPYEFRSEFNSNAVSAYSAEINATPVRLGCIFGDCLSNLRASLDYVAWQLAVKYSAVAPVIGKDRIYFPFSKDAVGFSTNGSPQFARIGVPTQAINIIESVQPYQAGYEMIGTLNRLVNEDKHCLPLLTIAKANTVSMRIGIAGTSPTTLEVTLKCADPEEFDTSKPYMVRFDPVPGFNANAADIGSVNVNGEVMVVVSLQNVSMPLEPVDLTLENIIKAVANIVPRFEPFF